MRPLLIFHAELQNDSTPHGRLELLELGEYPQVRTVERYIALSGLPGWQRWDDQNSRGRGPIPRADVAKIACYQVVTKPVWVGAEEQPGIAGNFYEILPSFVENGRGLFGVHFDANVMGTAGCVGIKNAPAWNAFEQRMLALHQAGVEQVPLHVGYS